jgi:hypothetical protein
VNTITNHLHALLLWVAVGQAMIALLNFALPRIMHWERAIAAMPLLVRQVFEIHAWFISLTLAIFAVLTWRFPAELRTQPLGQWLAAGIAIFWGIRTVMQVAFYSAEHWRGQAARIAAHVILLFVYGGFTAVYAAAAFGL